VIEFRASVVIGAGSLSFEMIQALVERLPVMICPRWVNTLTQPIAIDDVLAYLEAALDAPGHMEGIFEIGGPEVVSYAGMMRRFASLRGLYRLLLPVPVLTPHLSGLWLALVTPAQARVGRALVEGLKNSTVVRSTAARETFRIAPMPFNAAVVKALDDGAPARLKRDTRTVIVDVPPAQAFAPIRRIGGETGWYFGNVLWQARGWLDRWLGGVGMNRGRRDADACAVGDTIDGWTVEAFEPDRRLRLSANLKLPGHGWLEFAVTPLDTGQRSMIRQTATFDPRGWMGRAYWYAILPVHALIFRGLLRQVARRARPVTAPTLPRVAHRLTAAVAVVAAATLMPATTPAQMGTPVRTVSLVDLDRYTGDWFEIARFPNQFQRQCLGDVRASYTRRADSRIDVVNRCRSADGQTEAHGVARIVDTQTFARLKVRFAPGWLSWLPMVWGDYWIIGLAPDYSWAVVGHPDRNYLWILARTPHLNDASVAAARAAARDNGFDIERLVPTPQSGGGA
jgi:lipocalin